ncbi:DUF1295 domain-containing protein [Kitasatospora mediocidica]|uniref:DUF1295 domain-containing protein n=1 Tax=Kitasatospora mediocidica TaxID=58352 RepID=UPI0005639901|nr:DUF1295 domain-containing protein [Kitasatospora mediocidica]
MSTLSCLAAALVVLLAAYAVGTRTGRHRVVDVAWGLAFCAVALTGCALADGSPARRALVTTLVVLWGLRLSGHIALRSRGHGEDPRYERLLARRGGRALQWIYLPQAGLVWFVSLPVQLAQYGRAPLGPLALAGALLWAVGLVFEAVGDWQLTRFKRDPGNRGRLLQSGLWSWTRHPNYFGDACVWWGLYLLAVEAPYGWATLASPLLMTYLLVWGSGKALLERQLIATKPGYAAYAERTSGFLPRPPRRAAGRRVS